jgi:hypothetical protein
MRSSLLIAAGLLVAGSCLAQDFVAPRQPRRAVEEPAPRAVSPLDPDSTVEGVAAKGYGDGRYLVSWDPNDEGKPKGFILFGVRFW